MVIWKIEGDAIGANDAGAAYFTTKSEADAAIRDYKEWCRERNKHTVPSCPQKIVIRNRDQLANALNDAMGYGGSSCLGI